MSRADRFLAACRREPVDATPIWLMRQAGRYMEEYQALRRKYPILEMIHSPDLATEVTLQPVQAFDVDAAIIFADILPILTACGFDLTFVTGEGPVIGNPLRDPADVERMPEHPHPADAVAGTLQAIRQTRKELDGQVPLIGFSGAPFTLACYAIEGGGSRDFLQAKAFMHQEPLAWHAFLDRLAALVSDYLKAQVEAGAQVLQLFDSWAGALSPDDYRDFVLPYTHRILQSASSTGVPVIHFATGGSGLLTLLKEAGGDVIGIDWRMDLAQAWRTLGPDVALMGNLDPALLTSGPVGVIHRQAGRILRAAEGRPGHIFNLGHGVFKETPREHVASLIDFVHDWPLESAAVPESAG